MQRRRSRTAPPPDDTLPAIFTVRAAEVIEANKIERDAWIIFLRWCHQVPEGTKVELLRNGKLCAWLNAAGTRVSIAVQSLHAAPPALLA